MNSIYTNADDPERLGDIARFREIAARRADLLRNASASPYRCPMCAPPSDKPKMRLLRDPIPGREGEPDAVLVCPLCGYSAVPEDLR